MKKKTDSSLKAIKTIASGNGIRDTDDSTILDEMAKRFGQGSLRRYDPSF
jgi:hypothetical protein